MKVALVICPQWDSQWIAYPLALLKAVLAREGHEAVVFDVNQEMRLLAKSAALVDALKGTEFDSAPSICSPWADERIVEREILPLYGHFLESAADRVLSSGAPVVGFSLYFSNIPLTKRLAALIKRKAPGVKVVFGGPSCFSWEACVDFARLDFVDAVVVGEGDRTFPALVRRFGRTGRLSTAPGVMTRGEPSSWTPGTHERPSFELDESPFPDFSDFKTAHYELGKTVQMSRGCVRRCVFCNWWFNMKYRQATGTRAHEEILFQLDRDPRVRNFFFTDSLINGVMSSLENFCDLVIRDRLDIRWWAYAIVRPQMTPALLARAAGAGCHSFSYGIESGSERVLKSMNKPVSPALNARVLRDTAAAGVVTSVNMIVGFPTETEETFRETLAFVRANAAGIGQLNLNVCGIDELEGQWDKYNIVPRDHPMFWRTKDGSNTFPERLERLKRLHEAASDAGVRLDFGGVRSPSRRRLETYCEDLLGRYRAWETANRAPVS